MECMCDRSTQSKLICTRAVTLIECIIAAVFLSIAVVGLASSVGNTVGNVDRAAKTMEATRLAERMIEEIANKSVAVQSGARAAWDVQNYDGLVETPGTLTEASGGFCPLRDQIYARRVFVVPTKLPDLADGAMVHDAMLIGVTVESPEGWEIRLDRVLPIAESLP